MKSIEEIKDEYAKDHGYSSWNAIGYDANHSTRSDEVAKRYATEYGKEVQKNCAEKTVKEYVRPRTLNYAEISDLILSESNLPSHE